MKIRDSLRQFGSIEPVYQFLVLGFLAIGSFYIGVPAPEGSFTETLAALVLLLTMLALVAACYFTSIDELRSLILPLLWMLLLSIALITIGASSRVQSLVSSIISASQLELVTQTIAVGPILIGLFVYPVVALKTARRWYPSASHHTLRNAIVRWKGRSQTTLATCLHTVSAWPQFVIQDLNRSLSTLLVFARAILFRLFAVCLTLTLWYALSAPVVIVPNVVYIFVVATLWIGLGALLVWQIISGTLKLWVDIWHRITPPDPKPLRGIGSDDKDTTDADVVRFWMNIPKTIGDYESVDTAKISDSIWHAALLGVVLVAISGGLVATYQLNQQLQLPAVTTLFIALDVVVAEIIVFYDPLVEILKARGYPSQIANGVVGYALLASLPGMIIAKNIVYKAEEFVYRLFNRTGLHGRITLLLVFSGLTGAYGLVFLMVFRRAL